MAVDIKEDIIQGSSVDETLDGYTAVRVFRVSGVTAGTASGVLFRAMAALADSGVFLGAPHPDASNLTVTKRTPEPLQRANDQARIVVTYSTPSGNGASASPGDVPVVRFQGTVRQVTTSFNPRTGKTLFVDPPAGSSAPSQVGQASDDKAFGILTADWVTATSPRPLIAYVNTVNGSSWFGQAKWSWWIRDVAIEKQIGARGWKVHVEAELDPDLYVKVLAYRDPITGQVPSTVPQVVDRKKLGLFDGYTVDQFKGEADFGQLPIPQDAL